jgi:hypothetical protein
VRENIFARLQINKKWLALVALPAIPETVGSFRLDSLGSGQMEEKHNLISQNSKMCSPNLPEKEVWNHTSRQMPVLQI